MPRVTPSEHYKRYFFLHAAWTDFNTIYGLLPVHEQWQVHEFYQPSRELTKEDLLAHIQQLTVTKPALAHQAGKHVHLMEKVFRRISQELDIPRSEWRRALNAANRQYNPSPGRQESTDGRRVDMVVGVARPELDLKKFSKVLLELAKERTSS
ncbi:MAG: hypothetical protein JWP06_762 [Candidatus Saccharibacteria bacterium]|nr:hypothetical protein [Candidatus Saccharibacteria bacterium]